MRPRRVRLGWDAGDGGPGVVTRASMRPRRVRLGWRINRHERSAEGRRFNEAEARAPRMALDDFVPLMALLRASMRPRRVRLGWPAVDLKINDTASRASMRPRRVRLGWDRSAEGRRAARVASMRPRRVRLGWKPPTPEAAARL